MPNPLFPYACLLFGTSALVLSAPLAHAQATNGTVTVTQERMASGGGRAGSGNPMSVITVIGEPMGGILLNGTCTIYGGFPTAPADTTPPVISGVSALNVTATTAPPDTTPPSGSVIINSGAAATNTPTVTLTLSATDNSGTVSQMQCSNDNVTYTAPEAYATSKTWTLTSGDGTKTVYAKFSDPSGNWSTPVSGSINLDTTPPAVTISSPSNGAVFGPQ